MGNALKKKKKKDYYVPSGIYEGFQWNKSEVKNLIKKGKLAPFFPPSEEAKNDGDTKSEECPICFFYFIGGLNWCTRCKKRMCSECILKLRNSSTTPPTPSSEPPCCPFCQQSPFATRFSGPLDKKTVEKMENEEEIVRKMLEDKKKDDSEPPSPTSQKILEESDEKFFDVERSPNAEPKTTNYSNPFNEYFRYRERNPYQMNRYNFPHRRRELNLRERRERERREEEERRRRERERERMEREREEEEVRNNPKLNDYVPDGFDLSDIDRAEELMIQRAINMSMSYDGSSNNSPSNSLGNLSSDNEGIDNNGIDNNVEEIGEVEVEEDEEEDVDNNNSLTEEEWGGNLFGYHNHHQNNNNNIENKENKENEESSKEKKKKRSIEDEFEDLMRSQIEVNNIELEFNKLKKNKKKKRNKRKKKKKKKDRFNFFKEDEEEDEDEEWFFH